MSASAAAKQLGIHARTAQRWVKQYEERPGSIFESGKKKGAAILILTALIIHQTMVSRSDDDRCTADAHPSPVNGLLEIILDAYRGKTAKRKILYKYRMKVHKKFT
ncbi:hypothetical protein VTP01DRAFT_5943 [Rhizomucor pusillus]|uniref:uncharacterized protein n=1 Tax=Rhizomucor pusillus TaxID=4840 RepID=UPI0037440305